MKLHRWWANDPDEIYWIEITDRSDLGVDLNAPQRDEASGETPGYSLIQEIADGDIVFHYHRPNNHDRDGIVAWSRATGDIWSDQVRWRSHAPHARGLQRPYLRPGWRRRIIDFTKIDPVITRAELQELREEILEVRRIIEAEYGTPIYFPFYDYGGRELRFNQFYIAKVPKALLAVIPRLAMVVGDAIPACMPTITYPRPSELQTTIRIADDYRLAREEEQESRSIGLRLIDLSAIDRGTNAHARTQNSLAEYLRSKGLRPLSAQPGRLQFDLAWRDANIAFVAEVKSLSGTNEEQQLRLGLGQVLRYAHLLRRSESQVHPVLVVERKPSDESWIALCRSINVTIVWPGEFEILHPDDAGAAS